MTRCDFALLGVAIVTVLQLVMTTVMYRKFLAFEDTLEEILRALRDRHEKTSDFETDLTQRLEQLQRAKFGQMRMRRG